MRDYRNIRPGVLLNIALVSAVFALAWYLYYADRIVRPFYHRGNWVILVIFVLLYVSLTRLYDAFLVSLSKVSELFAGQLLAEMISGFLIYILIWVLAQRLLSPLPLLAGIFAQSVISAVWCHLAKRRFISRTETEKTVVVTSSRKNRTELIDRLGLREYFDILSTVTSEECARDLSVLDGAEAVFLGDMRIHDRNEILKYCVAHGICVYAEPRISETIMGGARHIHIFYRTVLRVERAKPDLLYAAVKRTFDILFSVLATVLLSPLLLVTAAAVKLCDGGPVIYRQERLTKDGEIFTIHKFRSMSLDAEADGVARLSSGKTDMRVTTVGRVIRRFRIDELPQLYDVLRGKMSVVGPRPERPELAEQYEKQLPAFPLRLQVKAGLTGYAQVYGRYCATPYEKLQMDLTYIAHPSFIQDFRLCLATLKVLFLPESTKGVDENQITAVAVHGHIGVMGGGDERC